MTLRVNETIRALGSDLNPHLSRDSPFGVLVKRRLSTIRVIVVLPVFLASTRRDRRGGGVILIILNFSPIEFDWNKVVLWTSIRGGISL